MSAGRAWLQFHSPLLQSSDFSAKPMVLLLGQYSVGKTSFIRYLLGRDYPGIRIGVCNWERAPARLPCLRRSARSSRSSLFRAQSIIGIHLLALTHIGDRGRREQSGGAVGCC